MPDVQINTSVKVTATITLTEGHLRALDAMACYGADAFLKVFYEKLGTAYMKPYEADLRSLLEMIRADVPAAREGIKNARKALNLK